MSGSLDRREPLPPGSVSTLLMTLELARFHPVCDDSMLVRGMFTYRDAGGASLEVVSSLTVGDIEPVGSPGLRFPAAVAMLARRYRGFTAGNPGLPSIVAVGYGAALELGRPEWASEFRLLACLIHRQEAGYAPQ